VTRGRSLAWVAFWSRLATNRHFEACRTRRFGADRCPKPRKFGGLVAPRFRTRGAALSRRVGS